MRFRSLLFSTAALVAALLQPRFAFAQNPFEAEIEAYEAQDLVNPPPLGSVVVTGSSSIAKWTTIQTDLAPLDVIARGFGGSSTDDLIYFLDRIVLKYQPRAVVIYEGENDITVNGQTPAHVATNMATILGRISAALPNTRVYVISIKATPAHIQLWAGWESYANQLLAALCATDARYTYIDTASHLLYPDGVTPIPSYYVDDGVHFTPAGYAVWTAAIRPVLLPQQLIPMPADSVPPTTPTGLTAAAQSSSGINLSWNGASDSGSGLGGYSIFRNGVRVASTTAINYSDTGLAANTLYTYTVTAFDRMSPNRNESPQSSPASATTSSGATPPPTVSLQVNPISVPSGGKTQLTWTTTNATSCTASGGWAGAQATSGSVTSVALSVTTVFTLTCTGPGGSAGDSKTVNIGPLPPGTWGSNDIGSVGAAGSSTQTTAADGTITATVKGSGADIWDAVDAFQFDYQSVTGDGTITAHVVSLTNTDPWAKAGVMIRETLSPSSTHGIVAVTPSNGVAFQRRETTGGTSVHTYGPAVAAPYWVRLTRLGNTLTAYASVDGATWTLVGTDTIPMAATVYFGLAVTAHRAGSLNTASFDHVSIGPPAAPPAPTASLAANPMSVASGATTNLSWTSTNATSCNASGGWSGAKATSGSATSGALATTTTFTLTCTGAGGTASDSKTVTVTAAPSVSLSANPMTVANGATTNLSWTSANVTSCTASGGWSGSQPTSGSATSGALSTSTTFTLTCTGPGGTASDSKTVTIAGAWSNQDIGSVGAAGSSTQTTAGDGTITATVKGSGADIWDAVDAFQFDYESMTGDGTITARVVSLTNTDPWAKAGVMIRETLSANSTHALVAVTAANGVAFQRRETTGALSVHTYGPAVAAPYWVRLTRAGNVLSAYASADGTTWTLIGTDTISMAATVYVGLAVTAHHAGSLNTANFDHVSAGSAGPPPPPPPPPPGWNNQDIGSVGAAGSTTQTTAADGTITATVKGSGADIWDAVDAFQFDYHSLTGNGTITARVVSLSNTDPWAKAGVMIRETLTPSSTHGIVAVTSGNGVAFQRRETTGGLSVHTYGPLVAAPYWVRLTRSGNTLSAYSSADGTTWTLIGTDTISMAATVYVGLAVTAHRAGSLNTANFDHVAIQ